MTTTLSRLPACTGTEPPCCCQPAPIPAERLERLAAEIAARTPGCCPHCGSGAICPSFARDRRDTWLCTGCGREFCVAD